MEKLNMRRRGLLSAVAATMAGLALARGAPAAGAVPRPDATPMPDADWRDHFASLVQGAILADLGARALHFWAPGGGFQRSYRISVPRGRDFGRSGETRVIRKVEGPTWRPTPAMREREPALPASLPPGPGNPFGSHALHLGWDHYRIHGSDDPAQIGGVARLGCIGLANADIAEVFGLARVGTPVRLV